MSATCQPCNTGQRFHLPGERRTLASPSLLLLTSHPARRSCRCGAWCRVKRQLSEELVVVVESAERRRHLHSHELHLRLPARARSRTGSLCWTQGETHVRSAAGLEVRGTQARVGSLCAYEQENVRKDAPRVARVLSAPQLGVLLTVPAGRLGATVEARQGQLSARASRRKLQRGRAGGHAPGRRGYQSCFLVLGSLDEGLQAVCEA